MKLRYTSILLFCIGLILTSTQTFAQGITFTEQFEGGGMHSGWKIKNNTFPLTVDDECWSSGGSPAGYIGAPYDSDNGWASDFIGGLALTISGIQDFLDEGGFTDRSYGYASVGYGERDWDGAHISKWLISPVLYNVKNGDVIKFRTKERRISAADRILGVVAKDPNGTLDCDRPNKMQVRIAVVQDENNFNIGNGPNDYGDFSAVLTTINPSLQTNGYPGDWQEYTIVIGGLPNGKLVNARVGFWYHFENGGYNNCRTRLQLPTNLNLAVSGASLLPGPVGEFAGGAGDFVSAVKTIDLLGSQNQTGKNGTYIGIDDFQFRPKEVTSVREGGSTNKIWYEGYGAPATEFGYMGSPNCPIPGKSSKVTYTLFNNSNQDQTYYIGVESGSKPQNFTVSPQGEFITVKAKKALVITVSLKENLTPNENPNIPGTSFLMIKEYVQNGPEVLSIPLYSTVMPVPPPVARCKPDHVNLTLNDSGFAFLTNPRSFDNGSAVDCGSSSNLGINFAREWWGEPKTKLTFTCADVGTNQVYLKVGSAASSPRYSTCPIIVNVNRNNFNILRKDTTYYLNEFQDGMPTSLVNNLKPSYSSCAASSNAELVSIIKEYDTTINYLSSPKLGVGTYTARWTLTTRSIGPRSVTSTIQVIDTIKPTASCRDTSEIYFTDVLIIGLTGGRRLFKPRDDINPLRDINAGSSDNTVPYYKTYNLKYGIYSPWYTPLNVYYEDSFEINCNNIGLTFPVTLMVTDASYNWDTCRTIVKIMDPSTPICQDITVELSPTTGKRILKATELLLSGGGACGLTNISLSKFSLTCADTNKTIPVTVGYTDPDNVVRGCVSNVKVNGYSLRDETCEDTVKIDLGYSTQYFKEFEPLLDSKCGPTIPYTMWQNNWFYPATTAPKILNFLPGFTSLSRTSVYQGTTYTCNQIYAVYDNTPPAITTPVSNQTGWAIEIQNCKEPIEIINPFAQSSYSTWSYTLSGATTKTVEINNSYYNWLRYVNGQPVSGNFPQTWENQWDSVNPGLTTITLTAKDLAGNQTTVSYTYNLSIVFPSKPYVGLPPTPTDLPSYTSIRTKGNLCGEYYSYHLDKSPVQACPYQKDFRWYYEVWDPNTSAIVYELDSIPQDSAVDIPIPIEPVYKFYGGLTSYNIKMGYHDLSDGSKQRSIWNGNAVAHDTMNLVVVPENTTVQSGNDSTFTCNYTIPSPLKYPGSCSGGHWGYKVSGATNVQSVAKPGTIYSRNETALLSYLPATFYSNGYPSVPADSGAVVTLNLGKNIIEYEILEESGGSVDQHAFKTYQYTVTVVDTSNPLMVCPDNDTIYLAAGSCTISTLGTPTQVNGFNGVYGRTRLKLEGSNPFLTLDKSKAPDSIMINTVNAANIVGSRADGYLIFVFNTTGTVSFDWEYKCESPGLFRPFLTYNSYTPNIFTQPLLSGFNQMNQNIQTGTYTQTVAAGDVLRIGVNEAGATTGYLKIKNFSAPVSNLSPLISNPVFPDNAFMLYRNNMANSYSVGTYNITHTLININNNKSVSCQQKLTAFDNFATSLNCKNDTLYLDGNGEAALPVSRILSTPCFPTNSTYLSKELFKKQDIGTQSVGITSYTQLGDTVSCAFTITVFDKLPPTPRSYRLTVPLSPSGSASIPDSVARAFFYDNCALMSVALSKTSFGCEDLGLHDVTAIVADSNGNSATYTITVEITPGFAPTSQEVTNVNVCSRDSLTLSFETQSGYALSYQWQEKEKTDSIKHWNFYTCSESNTFNPWSKIQFFQHYNETYMAYVANSPYGIHFAKLDTIYNLWRPALSPVTTFSISDRYKVYTSVDAENLTIYVVFLDVFNRVKTVKRNLGSLSWINGTDFVYYTTTNGSLTFNLTDTIDYFTNLTSIGMNPTYLSKNNNLIQLFGNDGLLFPIRNSGGSDIEVYGISNDNYYNLPLSYKYETSDTVWLGGFPFYPHTLKKFDLSKGNTQVDFIANGKKVMALRNNLLGENRFFELQFGTNASISGKDSLSNDPTNGSSLFDIESFQGSDYIAYKSTNGKICVKKYDGFNSWSNLGNLDFSNEQISKLDINVVANKLYVLYLEVTQRLVMKQWNGSNWIDLGSPNDNAVVAPIRSDMPMEIVNINNQPAIFYYKGTTATAKLLKLDSWKNITGSTAQTYKPDMNREGQWEYRCIGTSGCISIPSQVKKVTITPTPNINLITKRQNVVNTKNAELQVQTSGTQISWQYNFDPGAASLGTEPNITVPNCIKDTTIFVVSNKENCYSDTLIAKIFIIDSLAAPFKIRHRDTICYADDIIINIDSGAKVNLKYTLYAKDSAGVYQAKDMSVRHEGTGLPGEPDDVPYELYAFTDKTQDYKIRVQEKFMDAAYLGFGNNILNFPTPSLPITKQFTVETWVRTTRENPTQVLGLLFSGQNAFAADNRNWEWRDGLFFVYNEPTVLGANYQARSIAFPTLPVYSGWVHIATTADSSGLKIYYDGVLVASNSSASTTNINNSTKDIRIVGGVHGYGCDEFRVWNTARTASEINANKNVCLTGTESGLVLYANFSDYNDSTKTFASVKGPNAFFESVANITAQLERNSSCLTPGGIDFFTGPFTVTMVTDHPFLAFYDNYYNQQTSSCQGELVELHATPTNLTKRVTWYNAPFGGDTVPMNKISNIYSTFIDKDTILYPGIANSPCQRGVTTIDMNEKPVIYSIESEVYCAGSMVGDEEGDNTISIDYNGNGGIRYYDSATGGTSFDENTLNSRVLTETDTVWAETYKTDWVQVNGNWERVVTCVSEPRTPLILTVSPNPTIDSTVDGFRYETGPVTLKAFTGGPGQKAYWLNLNGDFLGIQDSIDFETPPISTTTQFLVGSLNFVNSSGCSSIGLDTVTAYVYHYLTRSDTVLACESYTWENGQTYTQSDSTISYVKHNSVGVDSLITLHLTVIGFTESAVSVDKEYMCPGDSALITIESTQLGQQYMLVDTATNTAVQNPITGTGTSITFNTGALTSYKGYKIMVTDTAHVNNRTLGCAKQLGSIIHLKAGSLFSSTDAATCGSYTWRGTTYTQSGTYYDTLTSSLGCDSVVAINLSIFPAPVYIDSVTACNSYTWNRVTYTTSTNTPTRFAGYTEYGCDSIVKLHLIITHPTTAIDTKLAWDSITWIDGITYTSNNNVAKDTLVNAAGCDSVVTLNLTILNSVARTVLNPQAICAGGSYAFNGNIYTTTGTYRDTLYAGTGNDSIYVTQLTVKQPTASTDVQRHWNVYTWLNGSTYTTSNNTATRILVNAAGCDSVITLNLTILNSAARTVANPQAICAGGSYTLNGNVYTTAGTYRDTLYAGTGNDSIYVTQLTLKQPTAATDVQTHWDAYTWLNGSTYTSSINTATRTLVNAAGCDSVITLNLTILNSAARTVLNPQAICAGGSYTLNGNVYTKAGTYRDTLYAVTGNDSIYVTQLTVKQPTAATDVQTHWDTYTWLNGITYSTSNTIATRTLVNDAGCDSVITLNLTILNSAARTVLNPQAICAGGSYALNGNVYTTAGTYRDTLYAGTGNDSIYITFLTVNSKPATSAISGQNNPGLGSTETYSVTNTAGSTYNWIITYGTQVSGGNTNTISVLWSNTIIAAAVKVIETNSNGCVGDTITQNVALPVHLLNFTAQKKAKVVELNWRTSSENKNKGFDVERSFDATTFEKLGFVNGKGTTNQISYYNFNDVTYNHVGVNGSTVPSVIYYRLKQLDFNGRFEYSPVVVVNNKTTAQQAVVMNASPNPFQAGFEININSKKETEATVEIFDAFGKRVANKTVHLVQGETFFSFEQASEWKAGMYFIALWVDDERQTLRIVRE